MRTLKWLVSQSGEMHCHQRDFDKTDPQKHAICWETDLRNSLIDINSFILANPNLPKHGPVAIQPYQTQVPVRLCFTPLRTKGFAPVFQIHGVTGCKHPGLASWWSFSKPNKLYLSGVNCHLVTTGCGCGLLWVQVSNATFLCNS